MMRLSERTRAILEAFFVTILWSFSWVLIKVTLIEIPPLTFAGLRYVLAALVLIPSFFRYREQLRALTGRDWGRLAVLGLCFYTITQGGQFLTLHLLDAVTVSLILNFTSVLVAFFGLIGLNEKPSKRQWLGIAIFITGVLIYFYPAIALTRNTIGLIAAGITVCGNTAASILGRAINRQKQIPTSVVTVISMGIGAVVLLGVGLAVEEFPHFSVRNAGVIFWLSVVHTAFAFNLWNKSLQVLSAVESSIINNTMLIQIALLAWVFLGETLDLVEIAGLALAAVGIFLSQIYRRSVTGNQEV